MPAILCGAVLSLVCGGFAQAAPVIYVPFDGTPGAGIAGTTPTGLGSIVSNDSTTDNVVVANSITYGSLSTSGNKFKNSGGRADFSASTTGLPGSGLLDNGSSLWMSVLVTPLTSDNSRRFQVLLGNEHALPRTLAIDNAGDAVGIFMNNGDDLQILAYDGGTRTNSNVATNLTLNQPVLVVMEMAWSADGTSNDTFNFYLPGTDLVKPAPVATFSRDMNNTTFDTLSFGAFNALAFEADEIRIGATYEDVIGAGSGVGNSAYAIWAATNAANTGTDPTADEDGDTVSNGLEFVLGGTVSTDDLDKLPAVSTDGTNMSFSFKRAQQSIDPSTAVTIEVGTDLVTWPDVFTVGADTSSSSLGVTVIDNLDGTDTIVLNTSRGAVYKKFVRLKVDTGS